MNENTIKDEVLRHEAPAAEVPATSRQQRFDLSQLDERVLTALHAAADKKAVEVTVLDLSGISSFTDYFVITSGTNVRQVQAIADEVVEQLKKQGTRAARVEGYQKGEWILVDYGDFIVHVFEDKARRFYDLERLWRDAPRCDVPLEGGNSSESSLRK
ncbi:MAG: ribosome-associated protein [Blastocatellia bacterium]|jgi:ribosome-associated protein|nr:ribosome-associated protein [Blastocatellia bacterium]